MLGKLNRNTTKHECDFFFHFWTSLYYFSGLYISTIILLFCFIEQQEVFKLVQSKFAIIGIRLNVSNNPPFQLSAVDSFFKFRGVHSKIAKLR